MEEEEIEPQNPPVAPDATSRPQGHRSQRRRPKACDFCWKRKIRCDGREGRCHNCESYGTTCTTTLADGSKAVRGESTADVARTTKTPPLLASAPPDQTALSQFQTRKRVRDASRNEDTQPTRRTTRGAWDSPRIQSSREQTRWTDLSSISSPRPSADECTGTPLSQQPQNMETGMTSMSNDPELEGVVTIEHAATSEKYKYAGKNSTQVLAKSAEELFMDRDIRIHVMGLFSPWLTCSEEVSLPKKRYLPLIDGVEASTFINNYFSTVAKLLPFLDERTFKSDLDLFYANGHTEDPVIASHIYLVIAIGATRDNNGSSESERHFEAAWDLYGSVLATPYLRSVQALLLFTIQLMNLNKEGQALLSIGTAVRVAHSLGLHRALSAHKHWHERDFVQKDYNFKSCLWWSCYCLEKKLSFETGRPSVILDTECDVTHSKLTFSPTSTNGSTGNLDTRSEIEASEQFTRLCKILSEITRRLFSKVGTLVEESLLLDEIETVDTMLVEWKSELPHHMRQEAELLDLQIDSVSVISVFLHCIHCNAMLVIHRAALFGTVPAELRKNRSRRVIKADSICLNAARSLAKAINELVNTRDSWFIIGWAMPYCLNVVFVLYIGIMRNPVNWTCDSDLALMKSMTRCFSRINPKTAVISSFELLLDSLCQATQTAKARYQSLRDLSGKSAAEGSQGTVSRELTSSLGAAEGLANANEFWNAGQLFEYQDFFSMGGETNFANFAQLWTSDLALELESSHVRNEA